MGQRNDLTAAAQPAESQPVEQIVGGAQIEDRIVADTDAPARRREQNGRRRAASQDDKDNKGSITLGLAHKQSPAGIWTTKRRSN